MRQQGPWKLHPYNSDAQKFTYYHKNCPFGSIWNKLCNLAIMVALQIAPRTRINWLRLASTIAIYHNTCCPQISGQHNMALLTLFSCVLGSRHVVVATIRFVGKHQWSSKSSDEDGSPLGLFLFFPFLLKGKDTVLRRGTFAPDSEL